MVFIILGLCAIFGWGQAPVGLRNVTGLPGGFAPHGIRGIWMAVIMGLFSYNGIELIAVTSGEMADPQAMIPVALRSMAARLIVFYALALFVVVAFVPWTEVGSTTMTGSPFVRVFAHSGVWHAAGIMNFVVITAALSGINTNLYLCSRMLFSLSRGGYAPEFLGRLSPAGSPVGAIALSGVGVLITAAVAKLTPKAYDYLFGIALFGAMTVWMIVLLSHIGFRRRHRGVALKLRMPLFPYMQVAGIAIIAGVLVTMGLDADWRLSWIAGVPWLGILTLAYFIRRSATGP